MTSELAERIARLTFAQLPPGLVSTIRLVVLDSLACGVAGAVRGPGWAQFSSAVLETAHSGGSTVLGSRRTVSAAAAATVNGAAVHALNYDAVGPAGAHLGLVVPAVLATAETAGVSEQDLLLGCAVAAEVVTRFAMVVDTSPYRPDGVLDGQLLAYPAAVAGAARAVSLDADAIHSAFGLMSMQAAGSMEIMREGDVTAKAIYGAFPNGAAAQAVTLVERGLDARCDALGGEFGLVTTYAPDADRELLVADFGTSFPSAAVHFKPWPTTGHAHGYIEAALRARTECSWAGQASEIVLDVAAELEPWIEPEAARRRPQNGAAAANSIQFAVAAALTYGDVSVERMTGPGISDRRVLDLAGRIGYRVAEFGRAHRLTLRSGCLTATFEVPEVPLGCPPRQLTGADVTAKARRLLTPLAGPTATEALIAAVSALGDDPNRGLEGLSAALAGLTTTGGVR